MRLIEVNHGIELISETCVEVVAPPFGFGSIDDTDRAL